MSSEQRPRAILPKLIEDMTDAEVSELFPPHRLGKPELLGALGNAEGLIVELDSEAAVEFTAAIAEPDAQSSA